MDASIQGLEKYIKKSNERLITAASNSNGNKKQIEKQQKQEKEMGRETAVWILQAKNWRDPTGEVQDVTVTDCGGVASP